MKSKLILTRMWRWIFIFAVLTGSARLQETCHYSCQTCQFGFYQYCLTCFNEQKVVVIQDPLEIQKKYQNSSYPTGYCAHIKENVPNILGIFILLLTPIALVLTKSNKLFFLLQTLQNFSLFSFVDIVWQSPLNYLLFSIQYLLPCNLIISPTKNPDWSIRQQSFERLDIFFRSSSLQQSFRLLGVINLVVILLLVFLPLVRLAKRKLFQRQTCSCLCFSEWAIQKQINFLTTFFFFLIEETMLSLLIAYRFTQAPSTLLISCSIAYSLGLLYFLVLIFKLKIPFFTNKFLQYHSIISKKLIYPIFVIVDIQTQFMLFVFMFANFMLDVIFDIKNKQYPLKSTMVAYRILQGLTILFGLVYFFVEITVNKQSSSKIAAYFLTSSLLAFILCLLIESCLKIYQMWKNPPKNKNSVANMLPQSSTLTRQNTQNTLRTKSSKINQITEVELIQHQTNNEILVNLNENEKITQEIEQKNKKRKQNEEKSEGKGDEKQGRKRRNRRLKKDPELEEKVEKAKTDLLKRYGVDGNIK